MYDMSLFYPSSLSSTKTVSVLGRSLQRNPMCTIPIYRDLIKCVIFHIVIHPLQMVLSSN